MGQKIGNPTFIVNAELRLNVPQLLAELSLSEEHTKHIQAIQILGGMLDAVANRAMQLNDPILIDCMNKMKLIQTVIPGEGDTGFEDI